MQRVADLRVSRRRKRKRSLRRLPANLELRVLLGLRGLLARRVILELHELQAKELQAKTAKKAKKAKKAMKALHGPQEELCLQAQLRLELGEEMEQGRK